MVDDLIKDLRALNLKIGDQAAAAIIETHAQIAAAYEAASALPGTADWRWRFEPSWSAHKLAETIRALTPADATEALRQIKNEAYRAGQEMMRQ